jgi:hypothetical protein
VEFFNDNVMNPTVDLELFENVISFLKSVHEKYAGFHQIIHLGGDRSGATATIEIHAPLSNLNSAGQSTNFKRRH